MRATLPILGSIVLTGCASFTAPAKQPAPRYVIVQKSAPARPDTSRAAQQAGSPVSPAAVAAPSRVDVAQRAIEVFGDSMVVAPAALEVSNVSVPSWDMDVRSYETQERVAHYVAMFTGRSKDRIVERLERGTQFEPMIRAKLRAGGLPEDMYYLALVESGFDPHAYSRAAAVGMWQFMTSTARGMGMRVDWWVDERRDPVRSTTAAVRFLRGLRDQFGSLYLAAAAYNGGPGRISRGLARYAGDLEHAEGDDAFFVLAEKDYLKNETREYVPQLIAAALIAKEPIRYGMELRPREPFAYDSAKVPPSTPLAAVAKAAGAPIREIITLNSHLLRGMTPPRESYLVRLPVGAAARFDSAFAALPADDRQATTSVETEKGDSADRIARVHGISVSALAGFNPSLRRLKSGRLAPGQVLVVPTAAVASAALDIPDPDIERYPSSTARLKVHTVKRGEHLGGLARRYSTTTKQLMRINGMRRPVIFPGQTILLTATSARSAKSVATRKSESASGSTKRSRAVASKGAASRALSSKAIAARPGAKKKSVRAASDRRASAAGATKKRSGASSKAGARTKSKSAKSKSRAA